MGHSSPRKAQWGGKPRPLVAAWLLAGVRKRGAKVILDWAHRKKGTSHAVPWLCPVPARFALLPWRQKAAKSSPERPFQPTRCFPTLAILAGCKPCQREVSGQANKGVPTS